MKTGTLLTPLTFAGLALASLDARAQDDAPPAKLDLSEIPAVLVDEVAIPIPREVFVSLDKLGNPGWSRYTRAGDVNVPSNRGEIALLFGLVISDGFVAVEAEDRDKVTRIGRDVLRLATALGVKQPVVMHTQSIIDGANADEWDAVRRELDRAQETVRQAMTELRDEDFAYLVSLGGWLGGTEVLASILDRDYSADGSDLLNQPHLLEQISERFQEMPASIRLEPVMKRIAMALSKLRPLLVVGEDGTVSPQAVAEVGEITSGLVDAIYGKNLKSGRKG